MPSDSATGCGCALVFGVLAIYFAAIAVWAFLTDARVLYPLAVGVAVCFVALIASTMRRRGG